MEHRAVIFGNDGMVKILHGIDPKDFAGKANVLIDPVIPRGIPPHEWKLENGKIVSKIDQQAFKSAVKTINTLYNVNSESKVLSKNKSFVVLAVSILCSVISIASCIIILFRK